MTDLKEPLAVRGKGEKGCGRRGSFVNGDESSMGCIEWGRLGPSGGEVSRQLDTQGSIRSLDGQLTDDC